MPRLAPKLLRLESEEGQQLQGLLNRHSTPQQIALRAKIVLLADEGRNHHEIARELDISHQMARLWRKRWLEGQLGGVDVAARLQDAPRQWCPCQVRVRADFTLV